MGGLRRFDQTVETCASEWRSAVEWQSLATGLEWEINGKPGELQGVTAGYRVRCGDKEAFAKPSRPPGELPAAAHEKIASDLAFDLGLPVPPVILWDRGDCSDGLHRYCAVSLVPFQPADKWRVILRVPSAVARLAPTLGAAASAMVVFDSWIGNTDRLNDGNLVVRESPDGSELQYAYIDHTNAMTFQWGNGPAPIAAQQVGPYPTQVTVDRTVMLDVLSRVEALSGDHIGEVVDRIPESFLNPQRRECVRTGLIQRRASLRAALAPLIGANP